MRIIILLIVVNICTSYLVKHFSKTRLCFMKTCFQEDDDSMRKKRKNIIINPLIKVNNNSLLNENNENNELLNEDKPLYTLIWYDCPKCKELISEMERLDLKHIYINGGYYFYDITDDTSQFNSPLMYKEDDFIGDTLFDIYEEIYK